MSNPGSSPISPTRDAGSLRSGPWTTAERRAQERFMLTLRSTLAQRSRDRSTCLGAFEPHRNESGSRLALDGCLGFTLVDCGVHVGQVIVIAAAHLADRDRRCVAGDLEQAIVERAVV